MKKNYTSVIQFTKYFLIFWFMRGIAALQISFYKTLKNYNIRHFLVWFFSFSKQTLPDGHNVGVFERHSIPQRVQHSFVQSDFYWQHLMTKEGKRFFFSNTIAERKQAGSLDAHTFTRREFQPNYLPTDNMNNILDSTIFLKFLPAF